jgi:hypothetical protein
MYNSWRIYSLVSLLEKVGLTRQHRQALVVAQDIRDQDFFATVSLNRGYTVKHFEDSDEAKSWLKGPSI